MVWNRNDSLKIEAKWCWDLYLFFGSQIQPINPVTFSPKISYRFQQYLASIFNLSFRFYSIPNISCRFQHYLASIFKLSFKFHSIPKISYRFQHHLASIFNLSIRFHLIPKISHRLSNLVPIFNQSILCGSGSINLASAPLPKIRGFS